MGYPRHQPVSTSAPAAAYKPGSEYCVVAARFVAPFAAQEKDAVEHATNLIACDNCQFNEFLVVKVVARVRRAKPLPPPVVVEKVR